MSLRSPPPSILAICAPLALIFACGAAGCGPPPTARLRLDAVRIKPVDIEVRRDIKSRAIRLSERIRFGRRRRRARLHRSARAVLDDVVRFLEANPDILKVEIQAHTDNRGRRARKLRLSRQRAEAVKRYLVGRGVDAKRLVARGLGGSRPKNSNRTRWGRIRNNRVEFHIVGERGRSGAGSANDAAGKPRPGSGAKP